MSNLVILVGSLMSSAISYATDVGARVTLPEAYQGNPTVVNIWATWCSPCLRELPLLDELHDRIEGVGSSVLAINIDTQTSIPQSVLSSRNLTLPVLLDPDGVTAALFDPSTLPATYLVGADGTVERIFETVLGEAEIETIYQWVLSESDTTVRTMSLEAAQ